MQLTLDESDLDQLDDSQKTAVMESLMFAVFADAALDPTEIKRFDAEVEQIPWGIDRGELVERMRAARAMVVELAQKGESEPIMARIRAIGDSLSDTELREKVFRMMASIMTADDRLTGDEKNVMIVFASVFELTGEQIAVIKAAVKGRDRGTA